MNGTKEGSGKRWKWKVDSWNLKRYKISRRLDTKFPTVENVSLRLLTSDYPIRFFTYSTVSRNSFEQSWIDATHAFHFHEVTFFKRTFLIVYPFHSDKIRNEMMLDSWKYWRNNDERLRIFPLRRVSLFDRMFQRWNFISREWYRYPQKLNEIWEFFFFSFFGIGRCIIFIDGIKFF